MDSTGWKLVEILLLSLKDTLPHSIVFDRAPRKLVQRVVLREEVPPMEALLQEEVLQEAALREEVPPMEAVLQEAALREEAHL